MTSIVRTTAALVIGAGMLVVSALADPPKTVEPKEPAKKTAEPQAPKDLAPRLGEKRSESYYFGVVVLANRGPCGNVLATVPVPIDSPEQTVTVLKEAKTAQVKRLEYALLGGGVKQMRVTIPHLPEDEEASVVLTLKIDRREVLPPEHPAQLVVPENVDAKVFPYLGPSPYIESNEAKIQSRAKEIVAGKTGAWEQVRAIYDWVLAHVKYEEGPIKGALAALNDGTGDAEELTSLFIALCRANKVPARMVWVPEHCYPEFYLVDREGRGQWIACQVPGRGISDGSFGQIAEFRPILQKGDNFTVPEKLGKRQRYVSEFARAKTGRPRVSFVREKVEQPKP